MKQNVTSSLIALGLVSFWILSWASPAEVVQTTVSILLFIGLSTHMYITWGDRLMTWLGGIYASEASNSTKVEEPEGTTDSSPAEDESRPQNAGPR